MKKEYKYNNNIIYISKYHVMWCVKYRRKLLTGNVEQRLNEIIYSITEEVKSFEIISLETACDHVHLLCGVDPQYGINKLVKHIKGITSSLLREEFPDLTSKVPTLWTSSYFVATSGGTPVEIMKAYLENQETSQRDNQRLKWIEFTK